jgi:hypothetical protein
MHRGIRHRWPRRFQRRDRSDVTTLSSANTGPRADPTRSGMQRTTRSDGTVVGAPRIWLRVEGATLLVAALVLYSTTHEAWWLVPVFVLAPDFLALGYLGGTRLGAQCYNLAHATPLPAIMVGVGWWRAQPLVMALGLVWLAHIGVDRLLAYGLKYPDDFQHTHLGVSGKSADLDTGKARV